MSTFVPSKADIFAAPDTTLEAVPVPEWGGDGAVIYVKSMTGKVRMAYEQAHFDNTGKVKQTKYMRERLVVLTACDQLGNPLFDQSDMPSLAEKSNAVIQRLFEAATRMSGLTNDTAVEVEENLD